MRIDFEKTMSAKSDEDLLAYLDNRQKYVPDAVNAAVREAQKRGIIFPKSKLSEIKHDNEVKAAVIDKENEDFFKALDKPEEHIVTNSNAPQLYTKNSIAGYTIAFSAIGGSILLAINLVKIKKTRVAILVLILSVIYSIAGALFIGNYSGYGRNRILYVLLNVVAGRILSRTVWEKYIGVDFEYRTRSMWIPIIMGILISISIFLLNKQLQAAIKPY